mmetsp:Transcript_6748/g.12502  ORF Transcript_6748/g.12502 Transcript_6748/m.12502 type:complete len:144 (+) Transcript_6748:52-483(+)
MLSSKCGVESRMLKACLVLVFCCATASAFTAQSSSSSFTVSPARHHSAIILKGWFDKKADEPLNPPDGNYGKNDGNDAFRGGSSSVWTSGVKVSTSSATKKVNKGLSIKQELDADPPKSGNAGQVLGLLAVVAAFALHSLTEQ